MKHILAIVIGWIAIWSILIVILLITATLIYVAVQLFMLIPTLYSPIVGFIATAFIISVAVYIIVTLED